jgi:hypothetical protein
MAKYTVFQINIPRAMYDEVNKHGWAALNNEGMEPLRAKQDLMLHGADAYETWMMEHFSPAVEVDADSMDEVFRLTNLWDEPERINRVSDRVSSTSVGDIVFDAQKDAFFMVDDVGFTQIMPS